MNDSPFDEFVKEQFSNSKADVPERIWDNIIAARRISKPGGFWFNLSNTGKILASVSIILLGSIGYFIFSSTYHSKPEKNNNVTGKDAVQSDKTAKTGLNPVTKLQQNELKNKNTNTTAGNTITTGLGNNSVGSDTRDVNNQSQPVIISSTNPGYYKREGKVNSSIIPGSQNSDGSPGIINNENQNDLATSLLKTDEPTQMAFPFITNNARELKGSYAINEKNIRFPNCPTLERNAAGNKKYWEIYAGPDYVFDNYKTFGDTSNYNYLQKRKASTQFTSAFSAGVRYTRVFENAMSIRTGLNYSQVNEKFSYVNPNELKFITVITRRVVVRSPGDTLYFNDTLQYQQTGTHIKTTYNHYRNIDIPLVIGYELGNGKIHANINAGVIINVYSWYKGDVLDTSYQPVSITTGKGSSNYQFKTNIGVGFLGSVSVYYKMNEKMHLLAEPYLRYNLSPMSKDNLNLQQKNHTIGLRLGLRFDLP